MQRCDTHIARRQVFSITGVLLLSCCATQSARPTRSSFKLPTDPSIHSTVHQVAERYRIPTDLLMGLIAVESGFNPQARSPVGARGLTQLMPKTAASLAAKIGFREYDIDDPQFNVTAGGYYLSYLLQRFGGDEQLALAAYNTGPARVQRWQNSGAALPDYSLRYVTAVQRAREKFATGDFLTSKSGQTSHDMISMADKSELQQLLIQQLYGERPDEPLPN